MTTAKPVIAVIGSGAVGAYYGGRLAQHGHDVHFLLRSDYAAVRENGWRVKSAAGDFELPLSAIRVYDDPSKMPKADLVIVTLKTTANDQFQPLIAPLIKDDTAILTLQNGLGNEERLAELFDAPRVMGGMCFVCINRVGPGAIEHISEGLITLAEFDRPPSDRVRRVAEMMSASQIPTRVLDDLRYGRWEKLVWNVPFNGLSAAMNLTTDRLIGSDAGAALVRAIMREVIDAARAVGANLPDSLIEAKIAQTRGMGPYKTSMHLDMLAGRPMEVEAIFGFPVRAARQAGAATPLMDALYGMLKLRDVAGH